MKNILVPTDFSDNAWNALQYSIALFKNRRCSFYIFHVKAINQNAHTDSIALATPETVESVILKESLKRLQSVLNKLEQLPLNSKHTFITKAVYGFFTDSIKKEIKDKKIDLVIMGTKGASGLKKVTFGSNTGDVITKVNCPLLTVPEDAIYANPKEIAFPTDYHLTYDIKVLADLKEIVFMHNAALHFVYVSKKGEKLNKAQLANQKFLTDYFAKVDYTLHEIIGHKLETAVQHFTKSCAVDMIAMVAKNLTFVQRILFRPSVEKISYHTKIPFLILHEQ